MLLLSLGRNHRRGFKAKKVMQKGKPMGWTWIVVKDGSGACGSCMENKHSPPSGPAVQVIELVTEGTVSAAIAITRASKEDSRPFRKFGFSPTRSQAPSTSQWTSTTETNSESDSKMEVPE